MRTPLPPILFLAGLAMIALLWASHSVQYRLGLPFALLGLLPMAAGLVLAIRSKRMFRDAGTNVRSDLPPDRFVTGGPFRHTRNPMYLGMAVALFGAALLAGTWCAFVVPFVFAALVNRAFIRREEDMMVTAFGADWEAYSSRVRRWF